MEQAQLFVFLNRLDEAAAYLDKSVAGISGTPDSQTVRGVRLELRQAELLTARNDAAGAARHFKRAIDLVLALGENASAAVPETLFACTQQLPQPDSARETLTRVEPCRSSRRCDPAVH